MSIEIITILLFGSLLIFLFLGFPIAFVMGGIALIFAFWQMGSGAPYLIVTTALSGWTDFVLIAIPLFVLLGNFLERSDIAGELYNMLYQWLGRLRGGLAMATIVICAIFAAICGVSAAAVMTLGVVSLPSMLKKGYNKHLAVGSVAGGATLGILIPPSVIMILYGMLAEESVGKLFIGGIIPGIMLSIIFIVYIGIKCYLQPDLGPAVPVEEILPLKEKLKLTINLVWPLSLIVLMLGIIFTGVCTPTEAAAIGASGCFLILFLKKKFTWPILRDSFLRTLRFSAMIMWIVLGAKMFSHIYAASGASEFISGLFSGLVLNRLLLVGVTQLVLIIMGMFLDPLGMIVITLPVFLPLVTAAGFSTVWFGILYTISIEIGYLTPPFGFNLFYMKSVAEPLGISMLDIYKAVFPFIFLHMIGLILVIAFPEIVLWLPSTMIK